MRLCHILLSVQNTSLCCGGFGKGVTLHGLGAARRAVPPFLPSDNKNAKK
jgi:hypothetical protein